MRSCSQALTTRRDLSIGVGHAIDAAVRIGGTSPDEVALVSMSTTLATNAIVEGTGDQVGLVLIGLQGPELNRASLRQALRDDPVLFLAGGHDAHGSETATLDLAGGLRGKQQSGHSLRTRCGRTPASTITQITP
jgi:N-methylhydantoinase A/oxoprolinase/acetone carboxylase beta subunit